VRRRLTRRSAGGYTPEEHIIRICPECLRAGNIDERLEKTAQVYDRRAAETRALIGQLVVPTYERWCEEVKAADLDYYLLERKTRDEIARMTPEERAEAGREMEEADAALAKQLGF
jgi:hypothetical protein